VDTKYRFVRPSKKAEGNPLLHMDELYEAALDEFSEKSYDEASLNNIIKTANLNKGRFYYWFSDKMDLYICIMDRVSRSKLEHFEAEVIGQEFPEDFFEQIALLARAGLEYALREPRYYKLWRRLLAEDEPIKQAVRTAFPDRGEDNLGALVDAAYAKGQFKEGFSPEFIKTVVDVLLTNSDSMIHPNMSDDEIMKVIDDLMNMLRSGIRRQSG
jgi:TetR/AcrR family transcriptional regulator